MTEEIQTENKRLVSRDLVEIGDFLESIGIFLVVSSDMIICGILIYGLYMNSPVFTSLLMSIIFGACVIMWMGSRVL